MRFGLSRYSSYILALLTRACADSQKEAEHLDNSLVCLLMLLELDMLPVLINSGLRLAKMHLTREAAKQVQQKKSVVVKPGKRYGLAPDSSMLGRRHLLLLHSCEFCSLRFVESLVHNLPLDVLNQSWSSIATHLRDSLQTTNLSRLVLPGLYR